MGLRPSKNPSVVFEGRNRLSIKELRTPHLKKGEVLIKTEACTICGSDLRMLKYGHRRVKYPVIGGHEVIGRVVISRNAEFTEGMNVIIHPRIVCGRCFYCMREDFIHCINTRSIGFDYPGGFSLYFKVPERGVKNGNIIKVETLSHSLTLSEPLACVMRVWEKFTPDRRTLVIGDGPIGFLHSYILALHNSDVYIKTKNLFREKFLKRWGFNIVKKLPSQERDRFDTVVVCASTESALKFALQSTRKGGKVISFSGIEGSTNGVKIANEIHYRELAVYGFHASTPDNMKKAIKFIMEHPELEKLITHSFHYSQFSKAINILENRLGMKVLIYFKE